MTQARLNCNKSMTFICFGSLIYEGSAVIANKINPHVFRAETQHATAVICQITMDSTFQKHHP